MPRVLHLFNVFGATTERVFLETTLGLARAGWEITAGYESLAPEAPATSFRRTALRRVCVEPCGDIPGQMSRVARSVEDPARRALMDERFDLVHGHFGPRILQASAWLERSVPVVISVYGYDVGRLLRDPCWGERYRWAAGRGATFVTLAGHMHRRMLEIGIDPQRLRLIRLGIDLAEHAYDPRPAPTRPRFVFCGRFVEKKGADTLIEAMARLCRRTEFEATLELIGSGPLEASLRERVARLGLEDRVRFTGTVPFGQLLSYLQGATALVQPSATASDGDAEGAPMVLMHAQAAGVPCITTAHSGNPEVLPPDAQQFIVPERDAEALAAAMRAMAGLGGPARAVLQASGRRWIETRFDVCQTVEHYDALYRELTRTPLRRPCTG